MKSTSRLQHYQKVLDNYLDVTHIDSVTVAPIVCAKNSIANIKVVLFDIYGTILHSRLGEIGSDKKTIHSTTRREVMFETAWKTINERFPQLAAHHIASEHAMDAYFNAIKHHQRLMMDKGISTPDIDIVTVWQTALSNLIHQHNTVEYKQHHSIAIPLHKNEIHILALLFEVVYNPVQLARGVISVLKKLHSEGIILGIISNAQFYTPIVLEYLLQQSLEQIGFNPSLLFWSYAHQYAKPSTVMFERAKQQLYLKHVEVHEVLYVGNDIVNDIGTANATGFRSCLYYGDSRSINLLKYRERTQRTTPTTGIKSFDELSEVLSLQ